MSFELYNRSCLGLLLLMCLSWACHALPTTFSGVELHNRAGTLSSPFTLPQPSNPCATWRDGPTLHSTGLKEPWNGARIVDGPQWAIQTANSKLNAPQAKKYVYKFFTAEGHVLGQYWVYKGSECIVKDESISLNVDHIGLYYTL